MPDADNLLDKFAGLTLLDGTSVTGMAEDLKNGRSGVACYSDGTDKRYAVYQPTGLSDWYIFNVVPSTVVEQSVTTQSKLGSLCIGAVAVCAILLLVIMAQREKRRIRTLRALQEDQLFHLRTDPVTGLLNAQGFTHAVEETLRVLPADRFCAVVDFGILNFNQYNVSFGSPAGDAVLQSAARTLLAHCREPQPCARLSGDRFTYFVTDCSCKEELLERVFVLDKKLHAPQGTHQLRMTYGLYLVEDRNLLVKEMCNRAVAARLGLTGGENIVAIYDHSVHQRQIEDARLVENMEESLRKGEFVPFFQPKYDAHTERIVGAEALVRWVHPDRTLTPPDRFIPLFEQNGLITRLDLFMFETVCRKLSVTQAPVPVAVNFSRAHMYDADFPDKLWSIVQKYKLPANLLEIELTETAFAERREALIGNMDRLRQLGFPVAIDDFGSGYSSLNLLKDVRFDVIKLDKEFFAGTTGAGRGSTVIRHILSLAQALDIHTVAEGVENQEQLDFLRENGCEIIQGYYFCRPVPEAEFDALLQEQNACTAR